MTQAIEKLEAQLDSFDSNERKEALEKLWQLAQKGRIGFTETSADVNLHIHSFYSYNACGYSPSKIAWLAKKRGIAVAGIVDFDVFDGLEEFLAAARLVGLKGCVGIESRVYIPEFADSEINSPGEPGISYHMGVGLTSCNVPDEIEKFKNTLRAIPEKRNRQLVERVNAYLSPVQLDYEKDVYPLTPSGNATERHICLAYARKARSIFTEDNDLARFWKEKLGTTELKLPEGASLQAAIRAKTMKRGGVGYVQSDGGSFPTMSEMNNFIIAIGGIPTLTWLNGCSDGEKQIEKLIKVSMESGVAAINIIPDRNFTLNVMDEKLANLKYIVELAESLNLPIVVGTEMNSPGLKFVDDFKSAELAPMADIFLKGAHIVYGHSVLQKQCGMGYTSDWTKDNFENAAAKNDFYEKVGKSIQPGEENLLSELTFEQILKKIK